MRQPLHIRINPYEEAKEGSKREKHKQTGEINRSKAIFKCEIKATIRRGNP